MKITYDKQADAMYIYISEGKIKDTIEVNPRMMVDIGGRGKVIGIELLFVSESMPKSYLRPRAVRLPVAVR